MSLLMLRILLWIPFLLVVFIAGIRFCISGYKKGLWRALISLGATIVSAILSILIAKLLAFVFAPMISDSFSNVAIAGLPTTFVHEIVNGIIEMALSLVLFFVVLLILTICLKVVSGKIKREMWIRNERHMRLAGLGVGLIDALIFTLVLLLPFYGTLSSYMPALEMITNLQEGENSQNSQYFSTVNRHPIVALSGMGPFAALYKGLAQVGVNGVNISIPEMAEVYEKSMSYIERIQKAPEEEREAECLAFTEYLRKNLVTKDWFYGLSMEFLNQLETTLPETDTAFMTVMKENMDVLDMSKEEFQSNCVEILDFVAYALKHDFLTLAAENDLSPLYSTAFFSEAGELANHSKQAVAMKQIILAQGASTLFQGNEAAAVQFVNKYSVGEIKDPAKQEKEAEALMIMMLGGNQMDMLEAFAKHPSFGMTAVNQILDQTDLLTLIEGMNGTYNATLRSYFNDNAEVQDNLLFQFETLVSQPFSGVGFGSYCDTLCALAYNLQSDDIYYNMSGVLIHGPETLEFALDVLGKEYFSLCGTTGTLTAWEESYAFWSAYPAVMKQNTQQKAWELSCEEQGASYFCRLMNAAKQENGFDSIYDTELFREWIRNCYMGGNLHVAINAFAEKQGEIPLRLSKNISASQKALFMDLSEQIYTECYINAYEITEEYGEFVVYTPEYQGYLTFESMEQITTYNENLEKNRTALERFFGMEE